MKRPKKSLMAVACLIGLLDILLVTAGNAPITPGLTQSEYAYSSETAQGATGGTLTGSIITNRVSTTFTMVIPSRLKGQRVEISRVDFFSDQDVLLGSAKVSDVKLAGPEAFSFGPRSPGSPVIPPLGEGRVSFGATLQNAPGLTAETKIYTQVEGTAGSTNFRARSKASQTTGAQQ